MMLQRAVAKAGSQPITSCKGDVAPMDQRQFFTLHKMLVMALPVPTAGQGISMDKSGKPVQSTGMRSGKVSYHFQVTVTDVAAELVNERSWIQRGRTAETQSAKVYSGPVFHHLDGCLGCIAVPITFVWEPGAPYGGVKADRARVHHSYFTLDIAGDFRGMGETKRRSAEDATANRIMLCQHASRLRIRGAQFTMEQNQTLDLYLNAVMDSLPHPEFDEDDEKESASGIATPPATA